MNVIEELKIKAREINIKKLRKEINQNWVDKKINNYIERNPYLNLTNYEIKEMIKENDVIASFFAKDPSKQNISEKYFAEIIKNIPGVEIFENLSNNNYVYLLEGKIIQSEKRIVGTKTIDYSFRYNKKLFICSQKYTKAEGGAQDNQYHDLINFLENSINLKEAVPVILVDGEYYNEERIKYLKGINSYAIVCSSLELEEVLNEKY